MASLKTILARSFAGLGLLIFCIAPSGVLLADPTVLVGRIAAHPALWTVRSPTATAYLLGSIHILPPNLDWQTPQIEAAIRSSDVFVFEAPLGNEGLADAKAFIREHGFLPADVALPSLLDEQARKDYRTALTNAQVSPDSLAHMRPWLAEIVIETTSLESRHYAPQNGVDQQIYALAMARGKPVRTFETIDQQLSLLMPENQHLEVAEFDASLRQMQSELNRIGPLVDAWAHGDVATVARLMNDDLEKYPDVRKVLLDNRNDAWIGKLKSMMAEHKTFFVTVGAGHLAGSHGVPSLLRKSGYRVEGP